jgi:hypothetical protein
VYAEWEAAEGPKAMFGWFHRDRGPRPPTEQEKEILRRDLDKIMRSIDRAGVEERVAFSISLALADTLYAKKYGGDDGFSSAADQAQRDELRNTLERAEADKRKPVPAHVGEASSLAWRAQAHRLTAVMFGDQFLLAYINRLFAPLINDGLRAVREAEGK